ncbi:YtxH domain-containing protein [Bacillus benzoevorans]|uniref:Gas vesicle protein n=1 Tax=Bacillus benzoevorans TaxID=1456 RepID=A0A7X0HTR3_9BACI|nr:YtxH domain-containing protein [Bacillus benzoevorans]MBB6445742.1 gas vesicle protein [Bacillus benzoevorans]
MVGNERNSYESSQNKGDGSINAKDFIIGTLIGGIVGSLTALLLAPKSGKELRGDINNQANLLKEKSGQLRDSAVVKGNEIATTVKDKTSSISKTVSKQSTELVSKVKNLKNSVRGIQEEENPVDTLFEPDVESDIQQRLEETKKAFDETESKINQS